MDEIQQVGTKYFKNKFHSLSFKEIETKKVI